MGKRGPPFVDHFWRGFPAEQIITHGRVTFCSAEIPFQKRPTFTVTVKQQGRVSRDRRRPEKHAQETGRI